MKKIYMLLTMVVFCAEAFSATETIIRETKGQGISRDEAIKKALSQAVAQAKGVAISSLDTDFAYRSASANIERKDTGGKRVEFDAVSVETSGTTLRTDMAGLVKTYEVLDERKIDDGTYEVTLRVWVYDYESPEQTSRLRLAVMPMKILVGGYRFGDFVMPPDQMSAKMAQKLSVGLSETNKFSVLDREYIEEFLLEKGVLVHDASVEELAKVGEVLGADYMIVGTISDARLEINERFSNAIGRTIGEYKADFVFDYRLIVGPTRQVKLADTVNIRLEETSEVKKLVKDWEPEDLDYRELADNLVAMAANEAVETIIDRMYPIRIASIDENGQIVINQGGKRIAEGLVLDVIVEGEEIIDVDTKESLGKIENLVATIKIEKVMPRISYARLVEGDLARISEGLICRHKKAQGMSIEGLKSNIEKTPKGGVRLPFD